MKNKLLLSFLFLVILAAGCRHPDDDIDFPEPEPKKPISELIQGIWYTTPKAMYFRYDITDKYIRALHDATGHEAGGGNYTLKKSGGKTYLELDDRFNAYQIYEIPSITDSTMTWEVTDSLAQLWDEETRPHVLRFKKRVKHPLEDKIIGSWNTISTTKVTYNAAGTLVKKEEYANETRGFEFEIDWLIVLLPQNGSGTDEAFGTWNLKGSGGNTYLTYSHDNDPTMVTNKIIAVTDKKMVWERKESATVSYIIVLNK